MPKTPKTKKATPKPKAKHGGKRTPVGGRPVGPLGSLHAHKTRKEAALASMRELELQERRKELVNVQDFVKIYRPIAEGIIRIVDRSKMSPEEKAQVRTEIAKLHLD